MRRGRAHRERVLISDTDGGPDGLRVDRRGNLYIATKRISIYTPEGKPLASIDVPETPTNCAFGGDDFRTLYITARTSLYRVRVPIAGAVQY